MLFVRFYRICTKFLSITSGFVVHEVSKMAKKKDAEKASQNDSKDRNNAAENGERDEESFSDPEGFVDDVTDEGA